MALDETQTYPGPAPFSVTVGGIVTFENGQGGEGLIPLKGGINWVLRDLADGTIVHASQNVGSDLRTTAPLIPGRSYETVSVESDSPPVENTAQADPERLGLMAGTLIMTTKGEIPVEALQPGDRVITRDRGMQPVRWIGRHTDKSDAPLAPVAFAPGTLKNARTLFVAPGTGVVVKGAEALANYGVKEALVPARTISAKGVIGQDRAGQIDYIQLAFERHEIVYAEAAAVESFLIDQAGMDTLNPDQIEQLLGLGLSHERSARPTV